MLCFFSNCIKDDFSSKYELYCIKIILNFRYDNVFCFVAIWLVFQKIFFQSNDQTTVCHTFARKFFGMNWVCFLLIHMQMIKLEIFSLSRKNLESFFSFFNIQIYLLIAILQCFLLIMLKQMQYCIPLKFFMFCSHWWSCLNNNLH